MRTAFFGGSFDPPHRGHLAVARAAVEAFSLDRVLFTPTGLQPLKPAGATASYADRLAMVELLTQEDERFQASTLDAPRDGARPNYTIDTLRTLQAQLPRTSQLFAIAGADSFLDLRRWRSPNDLLQAAEWIVVSRPGFPLAALETLALTPSQRRRVHLLEGVVHPASATDIRECLCTDAGCGRFLTAAVLAYIRAHRLYSSPETAVG